MKLSISDKLTPNMIALHHNSVRCEGEQHDTSAQKDIFFLDFQMEYPYD